MLLVADQPETHRFISEEERDYIITEIARVSSSEPITVSCPLMVHLVLKKNQTWTTKFVSQSQGFVY